MLNYIQNYIQICILLKYRYTKRHHTVNQETSRGLFQATTRPYLFKNYQQKEKKILIIIFEEIKFVDGLEYAEICHLSVS